MKKRIDVIANEEAYNNLSTFTQIEELNKTVRVYRDIISASIKRIDVQTRLISLLELLKVYSCKQVGVSYMCKNTIADKLELSYKTIQRLMKKLEHLGMIHQVAMKRKKDMLQTGNAIIIQPVNNDVSGKTSSKKTEKCPTIKTTTSSLKQNIKNNNKRNSVAFSPIVDKSVNKISKANFDAHWVPDRFANLASSYYQEAKCIQEFWKVVTQCNRIIDYSTNDRAFTRDQEVTIGIKAFKEFVMKVKIGVNMIKGEFAYFNGIVNKLMDKFYFDNEFIGE